MQTEFMRIVSEGIALLRDLPADYRDVADAQARAENWRNTHPGLRSDLVPHREPDSAFADYDLLIDHPDGGTLSLSWRSDDGVPWSVSHAQHWAANYVLTVDGESVTVQEALRLLRMEGQSRPDLIDQLVEQKILLRAVNQAEIDVEDTALQDAADRFRRARGLLAAADMERWLQEAGLTVLQFQTLLGITVKIRHLKQRLASDHVAAFEAQRERYDRLCVFEVEGLDEAAAARLKARAAELGLPGAACASAREGANPALRGTLATRFALEFPEPVRDAVPGVVLGPFERGGRLVLAEIVLRRPAELDAETRAALHDAMVQGWLDRQREAAAIEWHWT